MRVVLILGVAGILLSSCNDPSAQAAVQTAVQTAAEPPIEGVWYTRKNYGISPMVVRKQDGLYILDTDFGDFTGRLQGNEIVTDANVGSAHYMPSTDTIQFRGTYTRTPPG